MGITGYEKKYKKDVIEICHRTGFMGSDLSEVYLFNDKKLFAMFWALYYVEYEPENCFLWVEDGKAVGYILGSKDTQQQRHTFRKKMYPRAMLRTIFYTLWRHPESYHYAIKVLAGFKKRPTNDDLEFYKTYPAHLHIDILPGYQSKGIGSTLMATFMDHMKENGVPGIHLGTSSHNKKAVPFYEKQGFTLLNKRPSDFWETGEQIYSLTFGKKF